VHDAGNRVFTVAVIGAEKLKRRRALCAFFFNVCRNQSVWEGKENGRMENTPEVIVVGGGIAGLAATASLAARGLSALILEARERVGGRILTQRDHGSGAVVEFGAEFIHGLAPEIFEPLQGVNAKITEVEGDSWCVNGKLGACNFFGDVDKVLQKMNDREPDESFLDFLERTCSHTKNPRQEGAKKHALAYVSGFNAADPALIGVHWLVKEMRAEQAIEGHRAFRSKNGYQDLLDAFQQQIAKRDIAIRTRTVVESITWRAGHASVTAKGPEGALQYEAKRALITLPLAVLQAPPDSIGAIRFDPALPEKKRSALDRLEMGKVIRLVLTFSHRFWESIRPTGNAKTLRNMSFLFSDDEWFPTWWTAMPAEAPMITGWAPFLSAQRLSGKSSSFVVMRGLETLSRLLNVSVENLESLLQGAYFHDWQSDPFSRGAYSYGKTNADGAHEALRAPLENTLFFAGEAMDTGGNNGTVHGAIASGYRAVEEILKLRT
jgi:monoamine oxidase